MFPGRLTQCVTMIRCARAPEKSLISVTYPISINQWSRFRQELSPPVRLGYLLEDFIAAAEKAVHVAPQKQSFCDKPESRYRCPNGEAISHFSAGFGQRQEEVIVLHEFECAFNHRVLEIAWRIECRDFARKVLTNAEVFGSPSDELIWADKTSLDATNRLLTRLLCPQQMHFYAS